MNQAGVQNWSGLQNLVTTNAALNPHALGALYYYQNFEAQRGICNSVNISNKTEAKTKTKKLLLLTK